MTLTLFDQFFDGELLTKITEAVNSDSEKITLQLEKQIKPEGAKRKITVSEDTEIPFENIKSTKYIIRFK